MSTVQEILTKVDELRINPYSTNTKVSWISRVEGWVKDQIIKSVGVFDISRIKDQVAYDLPEGVLFTNIITAYADKRPFSKLDLNSLDKPGYFLGADGKINIYPVPNQDDADPGLRFAYRIPHVPFKYPDNKDTVLLIPEPYDQIYELYIYAMIDWYNREYTAYNNSMAMYNEAWKEAANWYKRAAPVGSVQIHNIW